MAASAEDQKQVSLKMLVDVAENKVIFAEAGKDFVDALFSFLTLPLGTIARLNNTKEKKNNFGSLDSLYESVSNMDEKQFWTETCKQMLLRPRNSMESYCRKMKLNIDDTEETKYYVCQSLECNRRRPWGGLLSTFKNQRCDCGKLMSYEICFDESLASANRDGEGEGFVEDTATFLVSDDLTVKPDDPGASVFLPMNLGYESFDAIKEVTVTVTQKEIMDLLMHSLVSKTPLSDTFLGKNQCLKDTKPISVSNFDIGELEDAVGGKMMKIKIMLRKSDMKILFALAEEDFVDLVFSFLTFPLGGVEHMLNGKSCLGSIDNLYKSIVDLDDSNYLSSPYLKDKLAKSRLAHQFKLHNQFLPIDEVVTTDYSCHSFYTNDGKEIRNLAVFQIYREYCRHVYAPLSYLDPKSLAGTGFAKGPSLYMVTDDLVVTLCSSISAVSFLKKLNIPPSDLQEVKISIGTKEALKLLKASLVSSSALTDGLSQFIKPIKEEPLPNQQWK